MVHLHHSANVLNMNLDQEILVQIQEF